ncbi:MAG: branched-chain amino acid ABC transporter permease [Deltaproteobacteria bacterium]|nr:branched-chain amino acid ABC transporter permease [Deltaproteobacteria bacterium]MBW1817083.1 branched-chain amino acid ABC transporter permease [Deltaproteobacteria bacterium]
MAFLVQAIIIGMVKGAIYVIIALSMVIVYKSSRVFNFAIGEFCTMGAALYFAATLFGLPFYLMLPIFLIFVVIAAGAIEKILIEPLSGRDPFSAIMVTIGLSIFLIGLFQITVGTSGENVEVNLPDLTFEAGQFFFTSEQIWSSILAVSCIAILLVFYNYTRWGIIMRATAEGQVKAMAFGINTRFALMLTWIISSIVAAIAGVLVAWTGTLTYNMGIVAFVAIPVVLVAGLESILGCILGGLMVGIVESLTTFYLEPAIGLEGFRMVTPYLFLLLVLMIRPTGLFGQVEIERV